MTTAPGKIKVGISTCLLGEMVRFDGGHKHDRYVTETLGNYFEWVAVCPEVEVGLGVPRPTLRFERSDGQVRLVQPKTGTDLTERMQKFSQKRVKRLGKQDIYGYILKSKSPSCGMERVKIYQGHAVSPSNNGVGVFAEALLQTWPNLPIEEEGRLCDPGLRENWINRVFAYYSWRHELFPRPTIGKLVAFHTRYKFSLLAHCETSYRKLGRLVAEAKSYEIKDLVAEYESLFMGTMKKPAKRSKHVNVMEHMAGFFKKELDPEVRQEIIASIDDYRAGIVPLIVPVTLLKHYAKLQKVKYLQGQAYLSPHPKELSLLSNV